MQINAYSCIRQNQPKESSMSKAIALVYSGGLDTSICIPFVKENYGYQRVVTITVDVGQPKEDIQQASERAKALGTEHYTIDAKKEFVEEYCFKALQANALYEGYPLSTSLARPVIAVKAAKLAQSLGIEDFAHGCTGKGNDQFRIEYGIRAVLPTAKILAPIREHNMTRTWEIQYAKERNLPIQQSLDKIWSIDENLWGRSVEGGKLEDPNFTPPEEIFAWTKGKFSGKNEWNSDPLQLTVGFENGIPVSIQGKKTDSVALVSTLNTWAGEHGYGRIDIMENRILGLKARENYECPAAMTLLKAHEALEALVLTKQEMKFKKLVQEEWSELAYQGLWFDPYKSALEGFISKTQERVTGEVRLELFHGQCTVKGRSSPWALYNEAMVSFDDAQAFDQNQSKGMVDLFGLQGRMVNAMKSKL